MAQNKKQEQEKEQGQGIRGWDRGFREGGYREQEYLDINYNDITITAVQVLSFPKYILHIKRHDIKRKL